MSVRETDTVPQIELRSLDELWFQVAGTVCNLTCRHCFISCSPHNHSFEFLTLPEVESALQQSVAHGVREYYFTGGEPFLNKDLVRMLTRTLDFGPATVLTNGTVLKPEWLRQLRAAEDASGYSLELRVSIDGPTPEINDPVRGEGTFERAIRGVAMLCDHGFLPIVTMTQTWDDAQSLRILEGFRSVLKQHGCDRPRLKILPRLKIGAEAERSEGYRDAERITERMMDGFDRDQLLCHHSRVVTSRGVYVCPILLEAADARMGDSLPQSLGSFPLSHGACYTCYQYGADLYKHNAATTRGGAGHMKLALFGGLYSNDLALERAIADADARGADAKYCLGDLGAFGPHPDRVFPILRRHNTVCVQGNYDDSIGNELNDCQCGYTDPQDNYFAQLSYDYTLAGTSADNKAWLRELPQQIRLEVAGLRVLLCHGSPRRTNEFLWNSTTSTAFLNRLADEHAADIIIGTHSGIHWQRELNHGRRFINCGVLGRPENDGTTNVWYAMLTIGPAAGPVALPCTAGGASVPVSVEFVPVEYDYKRLADEMRNEKLPAEFIETVLTGWWTTCLEVLPSRERRPGKF